MRKIWFMLLFCSLAAHAQQSESSDFDAVMNACIEMSDAVATQDTIALRKASNALRTCQTSLFGSLVSDDEGVQFSLNGYFLFEPEFADGLVEGKDIYESADSILLVKLFTTQSKGQTPDGSIKTKNVLVKAGQKAAYSFSATGPFQKIGVVAEPGGLVTMKIHVTNRLGLNKDYSDKEKVLQGMPYRRHTFELPSNCQNKVSLEIFNRGKKDCSFVVISN